MEKEEKIAKKKKVNISRIIVIVIVVLFLLVQVIVNRAEFIRIKEIGADFVSIFSTNFWGQMAVFAVSFLFTYILLYINNKIIMKGLKEFFDKEDAQMPNLPNKCIALVFGLIVGELSLQFLYTPLITCINGTSFGIADPIFGFDLGFYMFTMPFIKTLCIFLIIISLFMVVYTALYYVITINVCLKSGVEMDALKKSKLVSQIKFWAIVFGCFLFAFILVMAQDILTGNMITIKDSEGTELIGAGSADITIRLWGYRILAVIVLVSIINIIRFATAGKGRQCLISACVIPVYLVLMFAVLIYFQEVYVGSSELDKEGEYIGYNIEATKAAYGIDIDQDNLEDYESLTAEIAENNSDVILNIPIVNESVIESTIVDNQDNSMYYDYSNSNLGVYNVNGINKLLSLTTREIINDSNRSVNNRVYEYTHGYSLVVSDPTAIDENGYVDILSSNLDGSDNILNIKEPEIYYGLETNNTVIVSSEDGEEFDYPISNIEYETTRYTGEGGISLNLFDRITIAITSGEYGIIFPNYSDSKLLITRNVIDRAETLLPYIKYDNDPYLVVTDDGSLVWVIDGYTTSNDYPYAQSITITNNDGTKETINYIRNSVKVLADCYDGTVKFYITDRTDPIIMMYKNMYPDLFEEDDIPEDISSQFIYPKYLFDIQSEVIATYHDITEDMLYRAEDTWSLATDGDKTINSNYTMLKTVDDDEAELGLVVTYTKTGKGSLTSYLVGTTGKNGENKLSLYKFPSDSNIIGVAQMNTLIEEDETISATLSTLEVTGVKTVKDIIIVPIENTILYVEPIYQVRLNEDETQVLKKVVVSSGNKVAIGDNLHEAVTNLLSDANSVSIEYVDMEDINQVIDSLIEAHSNFEESMDSGDLGLMGKDIENLRSLLDQLEVLRNQEIAEEEAEAELEEDEEIDEEPEDELEEIEN